MSEFRLVPAGDVPGRLQELYRAPGRRKLLQAMAVTVDDATQPLLDSLEQSASQGDQVFALADRYSLFFSDEAWRYSLQNERRRRARLNNIALQKWIKRIAQFGVQPTEDSPTSHAKIIHRPLPGWRRFVPIAGRNHMKIYGSGDTVLSFGGVNCTASSFEHHDYLLETTDKRTANFLFDLSNRVYYHDRLSGLMKGRSGERHRIDDHNVILIDYGVPQRSGIYDEACRLVESADLGVLFVSQHRPGGKMEQALARKLEQLGSEQTQVIYNHYSAFSFSGRVQQFLESWTPFVNEAHPSEGFVHAKFIITYSADGSREALTGSHNFHEGGIRLGTAEIALRTTDDGLIDQLEQFARSIPITPATSLSDDPEDWPRFFESVGSDRLR